MFEPKHEQEKKPKANSVAGTFEKQQGEAAYKDTTGIYGMFAVVDRYQSAVTGKAMTKEVAQIRHGEQLEAEAAKAMNNK